MLIESLVKSTVELQGFRVSSVARRENALEAEVVPDRRYGPRCGQCGALARYRDVRRRRRFRHVPLWDIPMYLCYAPRRVHCDRCEGVHVESLPWVSGKRRFTRALMVNRATWAWVLTWKQVATLFHCSWGTVSAAVDEAVQHGWPERDLSGLTHIGIDEISRKRGHDYVTNVYDLNTQVLLWSVEGRGLETLKAFFETLGKEHSAQIQGVCCDMWPPYIDTIKTYAPEAVLVFDKFHIVQHLTRALDQVRRNEIREKGAEHKALMAKTGYLWLKNPWNLTEGQQLRLSELEAVGAGQNPRLFAAE